MGWTQPQLAAKLGTTQPTISDIETGKIASSRLVTSISELLKIGTPHAEVEDDLERRWIDAGRLLRARRADVFLQQLSYTEGLVVLLTPSAEVDESEGRGGH